MKYIMRQSRDGAIELVDRSPAPTKDHDLMSAISRVGWETVLIWYMRTLAWVWMAKGLFHWAIILGAFPTLGQFTTMALPLQATIVAFACLDLLAAIGLWLAAAWGGAIWLLCAVVEAASADPKSARGRDRLWRRSAQHRAGGWLFPVELAGGARTSLTLPFPSVRPAEQRGPPERLRPVNVNKAFDSIEIYHALWKLWIHLDF